jgi:hypothetical protein
MLGTMRHQTVRLAAGEVHLWSTRIKGLNGA